MIAEISGCLAKNVSCNVLVQTLQCLMSNVDDMSDDSCQ